MRPNSGYKDGELFAEIVAEVGLSCDDPAAQGDLLPTRRIEIDLDACEPLNRYNYRQNYVFCHACDRHNHYLGITISTPNGLALIGHNCAEKHFGKEAAQRLEGRLCKLENDAYFKKIVEPLERATAKIAIELDRLEHVCVELDRNISKCRVEAPRLLDVVETAARLRGGRLVVERSGPEVVGLIRGGEALLRNTDLTLMHKRIRLELSQLGRSAIARPSSRSELRELDSIYRLVVQHLASLVTHINQAVQFLSGDNLVLIKRFAALAGLETVAQTRKGQRPLFWSVPIGFEAKSLEIDEKALSDAIDAGLHTARKISA